MSELHGIDDMVIQTPELNQHLSPRSSLAELQKQRKDKNQMSEWLTIMQDTHHRLETMSIGNHPSRNLLNKFEKIQLNDDTIGKPTIKIDIEDVQEEFNY